MFGTLRLAAVLLCAVPILGATGALAADVVIERGDSRRPEVEVPPLPSPAFDAEDEDVAPRAAPRAPKRGGSGEFRPGDMREPAGEHKPGHMSNERVYRPGDLN
jgi:hypothetical protein